MKVLRGASATSLVIHFKARKAPEFASSAIIAARRFPGVGGRRLHELCAAPQRGADWIRATVLGGQHQRDFRAPGVLRSVRIARELSSRDNELSDRGHKPRG